MMEDGNTYLEEFLLSLEMIPNDIRRDFELMKEIDMECIELNKELNELEANCIINYKRRFDRIGNNELMNEINEIHQHYLLNIKILKDKIKQKLSEKNDIAININDIIIKFSKKLDTDLAFFETELKSCGGFNIISKGVEPGTEVAFTLQMTTPQSVISTSIKETNHICIDQIHKDKQTNENIETNATTITNSYDIQTNGNNNEKTFMLGRVIFYHASTAIYEILDVDDSKNYLLPENQVIILDLQEQNNYNNNNIQQQYRRLTKGEYVYALYPDTTSFYPAIVVQTTKRLQNSHEPSTIVQFIGDEDETGQSPLRSIALKYIIKELSNNNNKLNTI